jgi:hypothetical protein
MISMTRRIRCLAPLCIAACLLATSASAQDYTIDWWTIDSGGDMLTTGGDFELSGTIGQHDASSSAMTGGGYTLVGGFWAGVVEDEFCFGDLDDDGEIGLSDLAALLANYGQASGMAYEDGDLDDDGDVDLADLAALLAVYGTDCR